MNLWVKRTGQLLLAALFMMACEDENSLLGFKNPTSKFDVNFVEIPLESDVVLIDSVRTDNQSFDIRRLLIGKYIDPIFGEVTTTSFTQIRPDFPATIAVTSLYDSLVLEMQLDFYAYGATGKTQESFSIHEITEDSISYSLPIQPYYSNDKLGYGPSMGEVTYTLDYDSLKKQSGLSTPDTTFVVRIKLNEDTDFSTRLFDLIMFNVDDGFLDPSKFNYAIKGLALAPKDPSSGVVGFAVASTSKTQLTLHYHTPTDTLTRTFYLDGGSFVNIETNRTGDLNGLPLYESIQPINGLRYLQNGSPVITRVDLTSFYEHIEDIPNIIFNAAQIVIEEVEPPGVFTPPGSIRMRPIKETNLFYNQSKTEDSDLMRNYWLLADEQYYVVRNDLLTSGEIAWLTYNDGMYSTNITLFLQDLFSKKATDPKLRYLGLYSQNIGKTVSRVAFNENKIKLRLYYTVPSNQ